MTCSLQNVEFKVGNRVEKSNASSCWEIALFLEANIDAQQVHPKESNVTLGDEHKRSMNLARNNATFLSSGMLAIGLQSNITRSRALVKLIRCCLFDIPSSPGVRVFKDIFPCHNHNLKKVARVRDPAVYCNGGLSILFRV